MAITLHDSFAIHPGPWLLEEILKPYDMTVTATAAHIGVTRPALSRMLNGHAALSPDMAIRFEKAFGVSAATLLRMQSAHDLARAKRDAASIQVERVPEPA
ncbi:HigA family addiction module antitoxin [Thermaurantiacus sp.]